MGFSFRFYIYYRYLTHPELYIKEVIHFCLFPLQDPETAPESSKAIELAEKYPG